MFKKNTNEANKTILSVVLVIAETLLSVLLKFDKPLRLRLAPLIEKNFVICVRTYLPHYQFFVTFSEKGVLLDKNHPEESETENPHVHITLSGSTVSVIKILLTGDERILKKLQFRGENSDIDLLKSCVENIGIQNVIQDVFSNLSEFSPEEHKSKTVQLLDYKKQLTNKEHKVEDLESSLMASKAQVANHQKQIKILYGILVILSIAVFGLLVFLFK